MPPDDPLGRFGPSLDQFLRKVPFASEPLPPICPYAKCTFGAKCRYYHPERASSRRRPSGELVYVSICHLDNRTCEILVKSSTSLTTVAVVAAAAVLCYCLCT